MADDEVSDDVQRALSGWARIVNRRGGAGWDVGPIEGQVVSTGDPATSLDWQFRRGRWRRIVQGRL